MPQSFTSRASSARQLSENFYRPLIKHLSRWDVLPFIGTVGANLTQNCYFLIENSHAVCDGQATCASTLSIIACIIDIAASGTQNIFQRFWTSLTWAWVARLSAPTGEFIRALRFFLDDNKEQIENGTVDIYMSEATYQEIHTEEFEKSIELISVYYNSDIRVRTSAQLSPENTADNSTHNNNLSCYYKHPKALASELPEAASLFHLKNPTYYSVEGFFKFILLAGTPWVMFLFQTISMLSSIFSRMLPLWRIMDVLACFLGALFGHGKYKVNNTMRQKIANKHWEELKNPAFYTTSWSYFWHTVSEIFFGIYLLLCTKFHAGLTKLGASSLRLSGVLVGISISLFYLNVGLFTKEGIEFTIKTLMEVIGTKNELFLDFYIKAHPYVDAACVISSLFFNAFLTQMPESIKKCDDLASKFEYWMDSPPKDSNEGIDPSRSEQSATPLWVHVCNVIDIAVFGLSANHSIGGLFQRLSANHMPEWTQSIGHALLRYQVQTVFAFCAAISNFIFTYVTAAPNQGKAWNMLFNRLRGFPLSEDDDSRTISRRSSIGALLTWPNTFRMNEFNEGLEYPLIPEEEETELDDEQKESAAKCCYLI